jgi:hypothetical protein
VATQGLLAGQPVQARQMLRKLLEGRLVFTPMADGTAVEFRGTGVLDPVLRGIVDGDGLPKASGSRWSHHSGFLFIGSNSAYSDPVRGQKSSLNRGFDRGSADKHPPRGLIVEGHRTLELWWTDARVDLGRVDADVTEQRAHFPRPHSTPHMRLRPSGTST